MWSMSKLYLSQFRIGRKEQLKYRLANVYELHKLLWQCFPGRAEAKRDFLFRSDNDGSDLKLLMLSAESPKQCLWAEWDGVKEFEPDFPDGALYWFRLRANPTVRISANRKLRALTSREDLDAWLTRKGERCGFALRSEAEYSACRLERFFRSSDAPPVQLNIVEIGGVLAVTDSTAFGEVFRRGIGRARAFGCGMLLLKRIEM